ncbi:MAG TPA: DUF5916 domain-containing protein [Vicinamibacterales bacterium]|nr:DUF5916 domain-containing protein [Vicinamibacterales bacterium]
MAPAVISRNEDGQATVRAVRLAEPLRIDGRLDEEVYRGTAAITDFIQTLPRNGDAPTERTEAWVMFDHDNFYVAARCFDSAPPDKWIANEMRRDANQVRQNDHFGFMIDTFHDRRNGYVFYSNPVGGRIDLTEADEGNANTDWNPVWVVRTARFPGGWTIEMAIPFKSLRYVSGTDHTWGIQMRRAIRRKNEWVHLTPLPTAMGGGTGFYRISAAATLVGLELPPASRNFELKPYGITRLTTDRLVTPAVRNKGEGDVGIDARYGITANLTADLTYNTDFAQVEVDEQQVNLTRFSLQLPEKREFFLEGRGIFSFAAFPTTGSGGGGAGGASTSTTPLLFYSRRIGLNNGRVIPIDAGGRITGKVGNFSLGLLNIGTADDPAARSPQTNFSVVRVKRDVLKRSAVGVMLTNRSKSATAADASNQGYGVDGVFNFFSDLTLGGYYARTQTDRNDGDDESYQARVDYAPDLYGAQFERVKVGEAFNPEVGFLRRRNFERTFGELRYSPRPKAMTGIRQVTVTGSVEYIEGSASGQVESRQQTARINVERENSDQFSIEGGTNYEFLPSAFTVARGVNIPAGGYAFNDLTARYAFGQQRRLSGTVQFQKGEFYDGHIDALTVSGARASVTTRWSVEPSVSINAVTLPAGDFTTTVLRARSDYGFSPQMFASALVQYSSNDRVFSSNLRFRWEYRPGSELFIVYTDERDTLPTGFPELKNRAFVVKVNRLLRF